MNSSSDLSIYFSPVVIDEDWKEDQIGFKIQSYRNDFPSLSRKGYALIFVPEFRGDNSVQIDTILRDDFRREFYSLNQALIWKQNFYDLGTIFPGKDLKDTIHAIKNVVSELIKIQIIPIIVGGRIGK